MEDDASPALKDHVMPMESTAPGHGWGKQSTNTHLIQRQSAICCGANGHILSQQKINFVAKIGVFRQFGMWTASTTTHFKKHYRTDSDHLKQWCRSTVSKGFQMKPNANCIHRERCAGFGQAWAFGPPWENMWRGSHPLSLQVAPGNTRHAGKH